MSEEWGLADEQWVLETANGLRITLDADEVEYWQQMRHKAILAFDALFLQVPLDEIVRLSKKFEQEKP